MAEGDELADEVAGASLFVDASLVVVSAEVDESGRRVREEVLWTITHTTRADRLIAEGLHFAGPLHEPSITGTEEGVGLGSGGRGLTEDPL